jgi:hypothetical protein
LRCRASGPPADVPRVSRWPKGHGYCSFSWWFTFQCQNLDIAKTRHPRKQSPGVDPGLSLNDCPIPPKEIAFTEPSFPLLTQDDPVQFLARFGAHLGPAEHCRQACIKIRVRDFRRNRIGSLSRNNRLRRQVSCCRRVWIC